MPTSTRTRKSTPELFLNRDLSGLEFHARVLEEAGDITNPLLERLRFATIVASNLDEFFMVRVAAVKQRILNGNTAPDPAGLTPPQQLSQISQKAHAMMDALYVTVLKDILPALANRGLRILSLEDLDPEQSLSLARLFRDQFYPALTPLGIDGSRPFPMLANLSLNLAASLAPDEGEATARLAVVQVPARMPRLVRVPGSKADDYVWLEEVIRAELPALFPGQMVVDSAAFRVSRDSELEMDDERRADFLGTVEDELRKRKHSDVVRLEIERGVDTALRESLVRSLELDADDVYAVPCPLDLRALMAVLDLPVLEDLRDRPLKPLPLIDTRVAGGMFSILETNDILLHHPYDAFDPVISLVTQAADDPDVLAIKQTLYRTSGDSPVVRALARAAEQGKQVTVLIELLARFDEESNIRWAHRLEEAGAHVIYGVRHYKTHAKILLIVRRSVSGVRRYVHMATGNYNDRTARQYTDFGLMTVDGATGEDASAFFNALTGFSDPPRMKKLVMAPTRLRERVLDLIRREQRRAESGQDAGIRAKMNSLVDEDIISALYEASSAGVKIKLNVRGICCLRPQMKGVSDRIEVVSIIDRFLEHSRVFHFLNGGEEEVYLSSADMMPRNLDRRIELMFPVEAPECRQKVLLALDAMFQDTVKARVLLPDGSYRRKRHARGEEPFRAQIHLYREAERERLRLRSAAGVVFEPIQGPSRGA